MEKSLSGVLNINKPKGLTSHDVVSKLRKILNTRKVGHTGTLDPDATGVLPIVIGRATKLSNYIMEADKTYEAQLILGKTTTTADSSGEIIEEREVNLSKEEIISAINSFIGEIEQIPPMYSALKKDGIPLYKLARQNITVEREKRRVVINSIHIIKINGNITTLEVNCSKGTYIRTLCEDIGKKLEVGGHMGSLCRTKTSSFLISDSHKLDEEDLHNYIMPMDFFFMDLPSITLNDKFLRFLQNGNKFYYKNQFEKGEVRVYNDSNFYGIYKIEGDLFSPKLYLG